MLVKVWQKWAFLQVFILKSTRLGFDFKTDTKRVLNALSNRIYKFVFLRPDFLENLVKVNQKLVSLTTFILKFTRLGFDIKTDSKRVLNALSNGKYKFVFLRPDFLETLVKVSKNWSI